MRVEKLERRLALTAGLLESAAYVDQESPYFHMSVLEGSKVERQIAFDIPWESVNRRDQVVLDFSIDGNPDVVTGFELRDLTAWQAVHDEIIYGPAPLATRTASGIDRFGNHLSFEEQVSVATVANITTDHFEQLAAGGMGSNESTAVQPDYLVTRNQDANAVNAQAVFSRGLGRPRIDEDLLRPSARSFDGRGSWTDLGGAGAPGTIGKQLPTTVTVPATPLVTQIYPPPATNLPSPDLILPAQGRLPLGSEGGPYAYSPPAAFSYTGQGATAVDTRDYPVDPIPLAQYSELTFVTRFIATLTFDVIGEVGDASDIVLTVNSNESISLDHDINLGSMSVVDSFVIDSSGNTAVMRSLDGGVSVAGRPLTMGGKRVAEQFAGWEIIEAENINGENVVFARRDNGVTHRLAADARWGLMGFSGIRNRETAELRPEARFPGGIALLPLTSVGGLSLKTNAAGRLFADGEPIECAEEFSESPATPCCLPPILTDDLSAARDWFENNHPTLSVFEVPVHSFTQTFTHGGGATGGGLGTGGASQINVTLETTTSPPPDHLVSLFLYEWTVGDGVAPGQGPALAESSTPIDASTIPSHLAADFERVTTNFRRSGIWSVAIAGNGLDHNSSTVGTNAVTGSGGVFDGTLGGFPWEMVTCLSNDSTFQIAHWYVYPTSLSAARTGSQG